MSQIINIYCDESCHLKNGRLLKKLGPPVKGPRYSFYTWQMRYYECTFL